MVICGLDIATLKSGAAVIDDNKAFLYSLIINKDAPLEERIKKHAEWAQEIATKHKIECCFHEEVIHVKHSGGFRDNGKSENIRTAIMIAQVVGAIKAKFYPAIVYPLTPSDWRCLTIGNIPAPKGMTERDALKASAIRFTKAAGLQPRIDDEAEAYCIARAGLKIIKTNVPKGIEEGK